MDRSDDRASDDSNAIRDTDAIARAVFSGLRPNRGEQERAPFWRDAAVTGAQRQQARPAKAADKPAKRMSGRAATMPIVIAGAVAISTLNLTGNLDAVAQPQPDEPGEHEDGVRGLAAASTAARVASVEPVRALAAVPSSYTVADGDTVSGIAERYGLSTAGVLALNGLSWRSSIYPGQTLTLRNGIASAPAAAGSSSAVGSYSVQEGDTIAGIAAAHGLSTASLLEANGLSWSSTIYPGQTIVLHPAAPARRGRRCRMRRGPSPRRPPPRPRPRSRRSPSRRPRSRAHRRPPSTAHATRSARARRSVRSRRATA